MPTIEELVDKGYHGIMVLNCDSTENRSGMEQEVTRTKVACRDKGGARLLLVFVELEHPLRPKSCSIESKAVLTPARYADLARRHDVQDNDHFRRQRQERRNAAAAAKQELEQLKPACPSCGESMVLRTNRRKGSLFWGCPTYGWKGCRGTREIPNTIARRIEELNGIIDAAR